MYLLLRKIKIKAIYFINKSRHIHKIQQEYDMKYKYLVLTMRKIVFKEKTVTKKSCRQKNVNWPRYILYIG